MEKIVEQGILYDFYGPLLTEHQQEIYEAMCYENLSLGEIALLHGISRQGVHDIIKRCDKILQDYESKLHLVERFSISKKKLTDLKKCIDEIKNVKPDIASRIDNEIEQIIENL